jgi:hypothetical protein
MEETQSACMDVNTGAPRFIPPALKIFLHPGRQLHYPACSGLHSPSTRQVESLFVIKPPQHNGHAKNGSASFIHQREQTMQAKALTLACCKEANTQLATGNNARIALDRALENGMKMLFDDPGFLSALLAASGSPSAAK